MWGAVYYRSTRNDQFNLPSVRTHEFLEVVTHVLQYSQSIVLSQRLQKVLDCAPFVRPAGVLF